MTKLYYFCGQEFKKYWYLEGHMTSHTREKPFSCHKCCQVSFHSSTGLRHHNRSVHFMTAKDKNVEVKKPRLICYFCSEEFQYPSRLEAHIMRSHTFERPFSCTFTNCNLLFLERGQFNRHQIICEFNPNYSAIKNKPTSNVPDRTCYFCSKVSVSRSVLVGYLKIHTLEMIAVILKFE